MFFDTFKPFLFLALARFSDVFIKLSLKNSKKTDIFGGKTDIFGGFSDIFGGKTDIFGGKDFLFFQLSTI